MLYYLRHGETVWNRAGRLQGREDSPLTLWGVRLAIAYGEAIAPLLEGKGAVRIHSSPMGRARQTAAIVADATGLAAEEVVVDPLLAEHDVGRWAGRSWAEIAREEGVQRDVLRDWHARPPEGETRFEMLERSRAWLRQPRPEAISIVVGHGGFSRALRAAYLGLSLEATGEIATHHHGRFYRLAEGRVSEHVCYEGEIPPEQLLG